MALVSDENIDHNEIKVKKRKKKDKRNREREISPILYISPKGEKSDTNFINIPSKKENSTKIKSLNKPDEGFNSKDTRYPLNDLVNLSDPSDDNENQSPKKKKKKKYSKTFKQEYVDEENEDAHCNVTAPIPTVDIDENIHEEEVLNDEDIEAIQDVHHDFLDGWKKEEVQELLKRMKEVIPKNDSLKYNSRVSKLDWDKIKFGSHSAVDCREKWKFIEKKVRGYRILSELIIDANAWLEKPWTDFYQSVKKNRHPDLPKRPLTSYMIFYIEKKKKFAKKYPKLEVSKLSKLVAEKFNSLPDHKKEKYNTLAAAMRKQYNQKMEKFRSEHPEEAKILSNKKLSSKKVVSEISGPKKPLSPFRMFYQEKLKHIEGVKTQTETAALIQEFKNKWNSMSSKKKIPWIRWSHEAELKYLDEIKVYCTENPDFKAPLYKSVLSKKEKAILERMNGKPEKPPTSAYSLFSRLMLKDPELKEKFETPKERLQEIARLWKEVPKVEKDEYAEKVKHLLENYKLEYATYLDSLPEEKRVEELASSMPKKKAKNNSGGNQATKKLKQTTISTFTNLFAESVNSGKTQRALEELIKMEPVHPPEDPFILFRDEYLTKGLSEKKATKAWKSLSDMERRKYENKIDSLKQEYIVNFRLFLTGLKPDELNRYSAYKKQMKEAAEKNSDGDEEGEESSSESSDSSEEEEDDPNSNDSQ